MILYSNDYHICYLTLSNISAPYKSVQLIYDKIVKHWKLFLYHLIKIKDPDLAPDHDLQHKAAPEDPLTADQSAHLPKADTEIQGLTAIILNHPPALEYSTWTHLLMKESLSSYSISQNSVQSKKLRWSKTMSLESPRVTPLSTTHQSLPLKKLKIA